MQRVADINPFILPKQAKKIDEILADPAASFWLKEALLAAIKRDPVDALHDAECLFGILDEIVTETYLIRRVMAAKPTQS
jgi:hypothetical protein